MPCVQHACTSATMSFLRYFAAWLGRNHSKTSSLCSSVCATMQADRRAWHSEMGQTRILVYAGCVRDVGSRDRWEWMEACARRCLQIPAAEGGQRACMCWQMHVRMSRTYIWAHAKADICVFSAFFILARPRTNGLSRDVLHEHARWKSAWSNNSSKAAFQSKSGPLSSLHVMRRSPIRTRETKNKAAFPQLLAPPRWNVYAHFCAGVLCRSWQRRAAPVPRSRHPLPGLLGRVQPLQPRRSVRGRTVDLRLHIGYAIHVAHSQHVASSECPWDNANTGWMSLLYQARFIVMTQAPSVDICA